MNICHVLTSLEVGGMERMVCTLVRAQAESGQIPSVFCTDAEGEFFENVAAVAKICAQRRSMRMIVDWAVVRKLVSLSRAEDIEVLHAHNPLGQLYATIASLYLRIPVVVTYHGQSYQDGFKSRSLRRLLCCFTKAVIAVSKDVRERLQELKIVSSDRLYMINNGVDMQDGVRAPGSGNKKKRDIRTDLDISKDSFVVGTVGRLAPEKNYALLIRAFAKASKAFKAKGIEHRTKSEEARPADVLDEAVQAKYDVHRSAQMKEEALGPKGTKEAKKKDEESLPSISSAPLDNLTTQQLANLSPQLLLVGDGPERGNLERLARDEGVGARVVFAGMQNDVWPWCDAMDVFCLSSLSEGTSMALLEAAAMGIPAVVTDVGGNSEVVQNGVSGIVVESDDCAAFESALLRMSVDPELRLEMGRSAKEYCLRTYSASAMASRYSEVYSNVINRESSH